MIPEGKYLARPLEFGFFVTNAGKEHLQVELLLATGETMTWYGYLSEAALNRTIATLRALGWTGNDLSDRESIKLDRDVEVTVVHEEWQGKTRAKIRWVNAPGKGMNDKRPMSSEEMKALADRIKKALKPNPALPALPDDMPF